MRLASLLAVALGATAAQAQSTIYGLDLRNGMFFTSNTSGFVANYTPLGVSANPIYALDFDQTATTLWGIQDGTLEYGTFDLLTGLFTPMGVITGPTIGVSGLTCSASGTWYACEYNNTNNRSYLYSGDVTTGTFNLVGLMAGGIFIDIAISSTGQMYGHNISDDRLYSINTSTGQATSIGPTGQPGNFAQGMDFDWSNNTLYAAIYTTGGVGFFCTMNLTTGAATVIDTTTPLNGEYEFAVKEGTVVSGTPVCFGDGSGTQCPCFNTGGTGQGCANGTGGGGVLSSSGTASVTGDTFTLTANGVINNNGLFFQGNNTIAGGNGSTFGDGIRCCGGGVVRIQVVNPPGTTSPATAQMTETATTNGPPGTITAGTKKCYQFWYRDPSTSPCGAQFNLTNAVTVTWMP